MEHKKSITVTMVCQKNLDKLDRKANKIWVDKGSEFYNRSMKTWFQGNDTRMYSTLDDGKSVGAEWFIRNLKNKFCQHISSVSKNVYIDKLDDIVNKYNNAYHSTIKMKPLDANPTIYIYIYILTFIVKILKKNLNLKLVTMPKYQNIKIFLQTFTFQIGLKKC